MSSLIFIVSAHWISTPEKCLQKNTYPCVVKIQKKSKILINENELYLASNSLVEIRSPKEIYFAKGDLWGIFKTGFVLKTTYGQYVTSQEGAEFWLSSPSLGEHTLKVISGSVEVVPKGGESLDVPFGKQVKLSSVDYSTSSCFTSHVSVFDFQDYLKHYSRVFPFGTLNLEAHLQKVSQAVLTASHEESQVLRDQAARQLASVLERDMRLKADREAQSKLEIYLRKLFKRKSNYEEP